MDGRLDRRAEWLCFDVDLVLRPGSSIGGRKDQRVIYKDVRSGLCRINRASIYQIGASRMAVTVVCIHLALKETKDTNTSNWVRWPVIDQG